MKNINTTPGIGTDVDFLNGKLVDTQTLLNTTILQDIVQFFQKLKAKAGITENGLFDNEVNGYQLVESLDKRNNTAKSAIFNLNYYNTGPILLNAVVNIPYPYSQTFAFGRFYGIVTYTKNSGTVTEFLTSSEDPNLSAGVTLKLTEFIIVMQNNKMVIENTTSGSITELKIAMQCYMIN